MRAPFAYPLLRSVDGESGGAADLQTDIMRFMAILALCLMAIFALVQSLPQPIPLAEAAPEPRAEPASLAPTPEAVPEPQAPKPAPTPSERANGDDTVVLLTRPKPQPVRVEDRRAAPSEPALASSTETRPDTSPRAPPATANEPLAPLAAEEPEQGFTLRFESDLALSRLVARGDVGFFALDEAGARRMSVQNSRLSFWAAPTPRRYHEMDRATVPTAVRNALERTGRATSDTAWAVTLPPRLTRELERLMREHDDGALVIRRDGSLERRPS